jgi:5-carboxyvanillate decarboxylase
VRTNRYATAKPLKKPLSAYLRENFHCATSGMGWEPPIMHVHAVMGADRLLYAMDYPYQFVPEAVVVQDNLPLDAGDKRKFFKPAPSGYSCSDQQTAGVRPIGPCNSKHP